MAETREITDAPRLRSPEEALKMAHVCTLGILPYSQFYESRNKIEAAIEIYNQVLADHPTNWEALSHKGLCYHQLGKPTGNSYLALLGLSPPPEAVTLIEKALSANPTDPISLNALGTLCKQAGDLPRAVRLAKERVLTCKIQFFKEAVASKPDFVIAKQNLSIVLTDWGTHLKLGGKVEEGLKLYQESLAVCGDYAPAHYNIGVVYSERCTKE